MVETNGSPIYMGGNDGFGFGGGLGGILAILIIAMMFMGGGGLFGGNRGNTGADTAAVLGAMAANNSYKPQYATQDFVQNGFNFNDLQDQNRDLMGAVTGGTAQTISASTQNAANAINAIKDGNAALIREFGTVESALTALSGKQQECCCESKLLMSEIGADVNSGIAQNRYEAALGVAGINQNIAQNRYESAINTSAIQKTIIEEAQKNRDLFTGNRMADMQNQINQLQMAQALAGVPRYQPNFTYGSVPTPFCVGCGAGYAG